LIFLSSIMQNMDEESDWSMQNRQTMVGNLTC